MFSFIVSIIVIAFIGWVILSGLSEEKRAKEKFTLQYAEFLSSNEGLEIFCYTNRNKFQSIIETEILPFLNESICIIKLEGKEPKTSLDKNCVSYALNTLNNIGFPNLMKISKGKILDVSLHNEIYNAINNRKNQELKDLVNFKLQELRQYEDSKI